VASWKRSLIGVVGEEGEPRAVTRSPAKAGTQKPKPASRTQPSSQADTLDPGLRRGAEKAGPKHPAPRLKAVANEPAEQKSSGTFEAVETTIREATRRDAAALAKLLGIPAAVLAERLAAAIKADEPPLIAVRGDAVTGLAVWTILSALHEEPRGRITLLLVADAERRQGTGTALVEAVRQRLAEAGIAEVELLLDIDFDAPTAFLRRTGWERRTNGYAREVG
jgi:GNAT superfamily N-acetyltransferase